MARRGCEASAAEEGGESARHQDLPCDARHRGQTDLASAANFVFFTLRKAMLFGAVVGAVLAIAELRQLDEVASGTELGSGADNGFLEPPIAPPPLFPSPFTPAAARKAARSPLARAAPPLSVPPCSLPPAAGSRASERRV